MTTEPYVPKECPNCKGDGAVYEQIRVGQSATPFVCKQCDGDGEVRAAPPTPTAAEVKRIFSAHALKSDRERLSAEFDRFMARVKAEAVREAHVHIGENLMSGGNVFAAMLDYADRIEEQA